MIAEKDKKVIQEEANTAEQKGHLTTKQLEVIVKNEWFHLLVPSALGGKEMPLPQFASFMEEMAAVDGSFAWAVNLGAGANMFAGYMKQDIAKKIFSIKNTCVAGSGAVGGTAKKVEGGYIINGEWKYASGSAHANYFSLNAVLTDEKDKVQSFLVPTSQVEVLDTWNVMGLKASSSNDFKICNQKVDGALKFNLLAPSEYVDSPLYRFPFMQLAEINMLVMITGIAKHFKRLVEETAKNKKVVYREKSILLIDHPLFQENLIKHSRDFEQKRAKVFNVLNELWHLTVNDKPILKKLENKFGKNVLQASIAARKMVNNIYPLMGMSVIYPDAEINRVWRDFNVASQHSLLSPLRMHKFD